MLEPMAEACLGLLRLTLHLPTSRSLKSKRQVVSGLLRQVRNEFQVAAAEVGDGNRWQLAELAIVCVSNDAQHADEVLQRVATFVESRSREALVTSVATELVRI